jgi:hypothetical protein
MKNLQNDSQSVDAQPDYLKEELKVSLTGEQVQGILLKTMDEQNPHSLLVTNTILGRLFAREDTAGIGMSIGTIFGRIAGQSAADAVKMMEETDAHA